MRSSIALGVALTVVSAFAFGSGALFAKPVYAQGVGWQVLMAWRFLIGAGLAWAWLAIHPGARSELRRMDRRALAVSMALGVLYVGNSATYFAGLETVSASLAALIVYAYPAIVAVISVQVGRPLRGRRAWGALGLALVGVALAVGDLGATPPPTSGLILVAAAPLIYAVWIVLATRFSGEDRTEVGQQAGGGANPTAAGAIMLTATATVYWLGSLALGLPILPSEIPTGAWFGIAGLGVVSSFVAFQAFYAGAHRIGAARASLISTVEPLWTIAWASILLGEALQPIQLVGGALILGGVVIAQTDRAAVGVPSPRIADE
jgi:drug/metabolite transporter (DMT)-like permease